MTRSRGIAILAPAVAAVAFTVGAMAQTSPAEQVPRDEAREMNLRAVASSGEEHLKLPAETRLQFRLTSSVRVQP